MRYTIANFPFKSDTANDSMERCKTPNETMISIVKQFLKTKRRSRLAKNVGSSLPEMMFNLYTSNNLNNQALIIKQELIEQFGEFTFHSLVMEIVMMENTSTLVVTIEMSSAVSDIVQFEILFPKTQK